jgi:hypothetical protein
MTFKDVTPVFTAICPACHRLQLAAKRCRYCFPEPRLAVLAKLARTEPPPAPSDEASPL